MPDSQSTPFRIETDCRNNSEVRRARKAGQLSIGFAIMFALLAGYDAIQGKPFVPKLVIAAFFLLNGRQTLATATLSKRVLKLEADTDS